MTGRDARSTIWCWTSPRDAVVDGSGRCRRVVTPSHRSLPALTRPGSQIRELASITLDRLLRVKLQITLITTHVDLAPMHCLLDHAFGFVRMRAIRIFALGNI